MKRTWDVRIDGQAYNVELKNKKLFINGEMTKLNSGTRRKTGLIHEEHEVQIGSKWALLIITSMKAPQLIIDNRDCATGEEYVPAKLPVWAYLFVVIHCLNFMNGAVGALAAVCGIVITTSISSNKNLNIVVRILLDVVVVALAYIIVFGIAFALTSLLY